MGTFLTFHLAGGEMGMKHMLEQFGPALELPWEDSSFLALFPAFMINDLFTDKQIGLYIFVGGIFGVLCQPFIGALSDNFNKRIIIFLLLFSHICWLMLLNFSNSNQYLIIIALRDAIVNKFIKIAKKYKNGSLISSLSDTMPKHIRDKCINNGISPLQGMKEALFTIKKAIEIGSIWKNESAVKNYRVKRKNKNIKTYSEFESKKILKKIGIRIPKGIISDKIKLKKDSAKIGFPLVDFLEI